MESIVNQLIVEDNATWRLSGELTFATVGALLTELTQQIVSKEKSAEMQKEPKVVDLKEVTRTDSAGLAFLIELLKQTKVVPITFRNLPPQMQTLAAVSGVQDLLEVSSNAF
jgi:phospholipid transport system transporter-binding protein